MTYKQEYAFAPPFEGPLGDFAAPTGFDFRPELCGPVSYYWDDALYPADCSSIFFDNCSPESEATDLIALYTTLNDEPPSSPLSLSTGDEECSTNYEDAIAPTDSASLLESRGSGNQGDAGSFANASQQSAQHNDHNKVSLETGQQKKACTTEHPQASPEDYATSPTTPTVQARKHQQASDQSSHEIDQVANSSSSDKQPCKPLAYDGVAIMIDAQKPAGTGSNGAIPAGAIIIDLTQLPDEDTSTPCLSRKRRHDDNHPRSHKRPKHHSCEDGSIHVRIHKVRRVVGEGVVEHKLNRKDRVWELIGELQETSKSLNHVDTGPNLSVTMIVKGHGPLDFSWDSHKEVYASNERLKGRIISLDRLLIKRMISTKRPRCLPGVTSKLEDTVYGT
ncbi:hypothetical protein JX265_009500 [Neoarthrinium moseri]|uniref:Uncharacterized protein n=1 Tax=Neoarthrinium moseri TaxID=1658444 RepID=A0A9P9WG81_9PEZI|nr:hypothetical protein JX265_009500 [Neoarthrinium moseri]